MDTNTAIVLLIVVFAAFAAFTVYRRTGTLTPQDIVKAVKDVQPTAVKVYEVVQIGVNTAEQLKREKKITNEEAFRYALDYAKTWIPASWQVSNDDIIAAINAAVLVSSALSKQAGASSNNVTTQRLP